MFFFLNDTATTEIYTLSLHDALPIFLLGVFGDGECVLVRRGRGRQRDQALGVDVTVQLGDIRGGVTAGLAGLVVPVLEVGRGVAQVEVDVAVFQRRRHQLALADVQLVADLVAGVGERLPV